MKVALAQVDSAPGELEGNLSKHLEWIQRAVEEGCELIVFPELSLSGDKLGPNAADVGIDQDDERLEPIMDLSRKIDIVIGLVERGKRNLYNRFNAVFYYSEGRLLYRHRKLFLVNYAVYEEAKHYVPGNNLVAFDTRFGRVSMLVCNDAWHAAAPYIAALDGAGMLIVPAASARGALADYLDIPAAWGHMNRAYSAMMGFYTLFVNRVGVRRDEHGEFPYWGGSEIIDPGGEEVVKAAETEEQLLFGEVDMDTVAEQRFRAPILRDARLWIVRKEVNRLAAVRVEEKIEVVEAGAPPDPAAEEPML